MFKIRGVMQKNNNFIKKVLNKEKHFKKMVRSKGLEPLTVGTANQCSIHLSYERTLSIEVGILPYVL